MPTSSVGATSRRAAERGVTLVELLIVATLIALLAGISYPSVASGIDSLRLRAASDAVVTFLNTALDRSERRQQVVEIVISPQDNTITARSEGLGFQRQLAVPDPVRIVSEPRRFLLYPGGSVPGIGIEIATQNGRRRQVSVDPLTGFPRSEMLTP